MHFPFCHHSFQIAPIVQKFSRLTKDLVFNKMRGVNKEEAKRLSQLGGDRQKVVVEHNKEVEGTEMETKIKKRDKEKDCEFF